MTNVIKFYIFETPSTYLVNKKLPMLAQILKLTTYLPTFAYQQRAQLWHPNCYSLTCLNPTYLLGQQEASNVGSKTFSSPPTYLHTYLPTYLPTYIPTYLPTYVYQQRAQFWLPNCYSLTPRKTLSIFRYLCLSQVTIC